MRAQKSIHCAFVTKESADAMLNLRRDSLLELTGATFVLVGVQQHLYFSCA